ncbi:hypothetical protein [Plastoroseomonas hellenica]|uniref:hypothetical protein n=1 Tax=Plastoroseomonas hellenica TaxID=2687306 RepID=UPI001BADF3DD|nr:hypothetical protein [Plastoroseomonas hellenica]MBR0646857.1 hypothetical protein [Plastoroseomonas hellenica]
MSETRNRELRRLISAIPSDVSNDAIGARAPKIDDMFAPEAHAAALDSANPIVIGARGAGKSFWSGVLGNLQTKQAATLAYPRLGLQDVSVAFGYTGVPGGRGLSRDVIDSLRADSSVENARSFWWATILRATNFHKNDESPKFSELMRMASDWEERGEFLDSVNRELEASGQKLLIVYDALDTISTSWAGRRLLTEALLEVVWSLRGYPEIAPKLFMRPDQIDDGSLRFVELPKLRAGAIRLSWSGTDLYGLFFARIGLTQDTTTRRAVLEMLREVNMEAPSREEVLKGAWAPSWSEDAQRLLMEQLAGPFMGSGVYGYKKGKTYDWPLSHLADGHNEVTPRSFLGLLIGAAKVAGMGDYRVISPEGIRHGLRVASQTRVDQLHQEFPWIKGVLAPLDGLLLPQSPKAVFKVWRAAGTVEALKKDATQAGYLFPIPDNAGSAEEGLLAALQDIGVMFVRKDERVDMPDLYRVAARLLKKGGTAPL